MQEKTTELKRTSNSIPLDPAVSDYCAVLVLKPRLLREPQREKVTAISKQATLRASLALRRIGLPVSFCAHCCVALIERARGPIIMSLTVPFFWTVKSWL